MGLNDRDYTKEDHPPCCTCVTCNKRRQLKHNPTKFNLSQCPSCYRHTLLYNGSIKMWECLNQECDKYGKLLLDTEIVLFNEAEQRIEKKETGYIKSNHYPMRKKLDARFKSDGSIDPVFMPSKFKASNNDNEDLSISDTEDINDKEVKPIGMGCGLLLLSIPIIIAILVIKCC